MGTKEVTALCDMAMQEWKRLWRRAPRSRRSSLAFVHDGCRYRTELSLFRLLVRTWGGRPVACRWW
jgi:hypothetical protein